MITAVDTNVLIDVFAADPTHGTASREALTRAIDEGTVIAGEVVFAEVVAGFGHAAEAERALDRLGVGYVAAERSAAVEAGRRHGEYLRRGGSRERVVADFLVGGHAVIHADRLLTRDRGFFRAHFGELAVLDPSR